MTAGLVVCIDHPLVENEDDGLRAPKILRMWLEKVLLRSIIFICENIRLKLNLSHVLS